MNLELPIADDRIIWDAFLSTYRLPALTVALELDLFESLARQPATGEELAAHLEKNERAVAAILPMLKALGFLTRRRDRYHLTPAAESYLIKSSPFYWGGLLERVGKSMPSHAQLLRSLAGIEPVKNPDGDIRRDTKNWRNGRMNMEHAREIAAHMHSHSMPAATGLATYHDFKDVKKVLDMGGGSGCFAISIARHHPEIHCTVAELPAMCEVAKEYIEDAGMSGRVDVYPIDMFTEQWPDGYDAVFFSNVFHDWGFDTCAELAANAFSILRPGGRIFVHEILTDDSGDGPDPALALSVLMAMSTEGCQYTYIQLDEILKKAGFKNIDTQPAYGYFSLVSGCKI